MQLIDAGRDFVQATTGDPAIVVGTLRWRPGQRQFRFYPRAEYCDGFSAIDVEELSTHIRALTQARLGREREKSR